MKKILLSGGVILFVAAVAITSTGAFFSDTETSTGNTFTAGSIDLKVDSEQHYNGNVCALVDQNYVWTGSATYPVPGSACDGSWTQTDLGLSNKFFNFGDVKPGDNGEDTISLHIDTNPAWVCASTTITANNDVSSTEPELESGDTPEDLNNNFDGELAQNINFFAWRDTDGDNVWDVGEVPFFAPGPASNVMNGGVLALADSTTGNGPLPGGSDSYVGLMWCAGTFTGYNVNTASITCDGSTMGNNTQTDSLVGDITLSVVQSRNNPNFTCVTPAAQANPQ